MAKEYTRNFSRIGSTRPLGQIILFDDIEELPFKWINVSPPIGTVTRAQTAVFNANFSMRFLGAGGPLPRSQFAEVERSFGSPAGQLFSVDLVSTFYVADDTDLIFDVELQIDAASRTAAALQYNATIGDLTLKNQTGGFTFLGNVPVSIALRNFHRLSFSLNSATGRYIEASIDSRKFSAGHVQLQQTPIAAPLKSRILIRAQSTGFQTQDMSVDDVLVSQVFLPG